MNTAQSPLNRRRWRPDRRDNAGFVIVWATILFTVLLGISGFAVDLGNWYIHIQRAQRAADAAALAGDPYMPADFARAKSVALETLSRNGVSGSELSASEVKTVPGKPFHLSVTVPTTTHNTFLRFLGMSETITFKRTAMATHKPGLELGSGSNVLGTPPPGYTGPNPNGSWAENAGNGNYVLTVYGQGPTAAAAKRHGDRINPMTCPSAVPTTYPIDGCNSFWNAEHDGAGYSFRVKVHPVPGGGTKYLYLQSYGASFDRDDWSSDGSTHQVNYQILTAGGSRLAECWVAATPTAAPRWQTICNHNGIMVNLAKGGEWVIKIHTGRGGGYNDFLLQAGLADWPAAWSVNFNETFRSVTMSADKHLPLSSTNLAGPRFPLVQVPSSWAGQTINFEFFDIGDVSTQWGARVTGDMRLRRDNPSNPGQVIAVGGTCRHGTPANAQPHVLSPGCSVPFAGDDYQGQIIGMSWTVPSNYRCDPTGPTRRGGCWVYVDVVFNTTDKIGDVTTWTLDVPSEVLRLTEK